MTEPKLVRLQGDCFKVRGMLSMVNIDRGFYPVIIVGLVCLSHIGCKALRDPSE